MTATNIFYNFVGFRLVLGIVPPEHERIFHGLSWNTIRLIKYSVKQEEQK